MNSNYNLLIQKIDEFIRKYYKNLLVKGALYSAAIVGFGFLLVNFLEYFSWFGTTIRTILFYTFTALLVGIIIRFIAIPLFKLLKIGRVISHEQAAVIIGNHFADVKDVLLNTLQLKQLENESPGNAALIEAGIDQKINQLKPISFSSAVDLKKNRKYLRFALPPLILIAALFLISPSTITGPSERIIHHSRVFEKPAPFIVEVLNKDLQAVQQSDYTIDVKISGDNIPDKFFIETGGNSFSMVKENNLSYHYTFRNIRQNTRFVITADDYNSREYNINVLPRPSMLSFEVSAAYPSYTGRKNETLENTGDLTVPFGTQLNWKFYTRDTKKLLFTLNGKINEIGNINSNSVSFSSRMMSSAAYSVKVINDYFTSTDSLYYQINVIPDLYPSIDMEESRDSVYENRLYYRGTIKDDYGFSKLNLKYRIKHKDDQTAGPENAVEIAFDRASLQQQFYYFLDISTLNVTPGDEISYYFEVWDNDGVSGAKSTKSSVKEFKVPTDEEIAEMNEKKSDEVVDKMESSIQQAKKLQKLAEDLTKKLVDKKEVGWQEKQQMQQLLDQQQQLQKQVEELKRQNEINNFQQEQFMEWDPNLLEKQRQLDELFNTVLPDEIKTLYEEMQKLIDKADKDKMNEMLDKMKNDNKSLEKSLDRNLELFKQLAFEKKLEETIDRLDKLAEEQSELAKQAENNIDENIKQKQDELNRKFEDLQRQLDELEKDNKELEEPNDMPDTDKQQEEISDEMQNSSNSLNQGNKKNASKSQNSASQKMKSLKQSLLDFQSDMQQQNDGEDIESMRKILDNLIRVSFNQEDLMNRVNATNTVSPKYVELIQDQKKLKDNMQMIEDSLYSVAKRQPNIQQFVFKEIDNINLNIDGAIEALNSRAVAVARSKQQFAMTSINNLALMVAEALKETEKNSSQNSGSCSKPGGSSPKGSKSNKMKSMRDLQESLNKQLQQLKEQMDKPGGMPQGGKGGMSEQLARMAAEQEALRRQMQQMSEEMGNDGSSEGKLMKEAMQKMDQTETDLVNKRLTIETLRRQQEIVSRMLESEKAMMQREQDFKRESNEGADKISNTAKMYFEKNADKKSDNELIRTVPPAFKPFYKRKANEYFITIQ